MLLTIYIIVKNSKKKNANRTTLKQKKLTTGLYSIFV